MLTGHAAEVFGVAWNPRQDVLATGAADASARVWRVREGHGADVPCSILRHTNSGGGGAAGAGAGAGAGADSRPKKDKSDVAALEWSPDGTRLATGCSDNRGRVWAADGSLVSTMSHHTAAISAVRWSPSGQYLLSSSCESREGVGRGWVGGIG